MTWLRQLVGRLFGLFRRHRLEREFDEELHFHLHLAIEENRRQGMSPGEAERVARRSLGRAEEIRESWRDARGFTVFDNLIQDVGSALRALSYSPGFAAAAIITLALGLGVNTAVFAVTYGILLRPLPYADPSRLVILSITGPDGADFGVSLREFSEWQQRLRTVDGVAGYTVQDISVRGGTEPQVVRTGVVTETFFDTLGVTAGEGGPPVVFDRPDEVLVSRRIVSRLFGGESESPLGRLLTFGDRSYTIAAILPADVAFPTDDVHAWIPMSWQPADGPPPVVRLIARLKPWATVRDVRNDAARVYLEIRGVRAAPASPSGPTPANPATVTTFEAAQLGTVRPVLHAMTLGSLLVVLIACANVAILFLGRAAVRQQECAMRVALGASPGRLVTLALAESLVIAGVASVIGLAIGTACVRVLVQTARGILPRVHAVAVDAPVLTGCVAITFVVTLLCGVVPATHALRSSFAPALRGLAPALMPAAWKLRSSLVITQIALSMVLLIGAGLLARTVTQLLSEDIGIEPSRALTVKLVLGDRPMLNAQDRERRFVDELLARVRELPGVEQAGIGSTLPPRVAPLRIGIRFMSDTRDEFKSLSLGSVTPGYLTALGAQLRGGRDFVEGDADTRRGVVLSESAARFFFLDQDAVGQRITWRLPPIVKMPEPPLVLGVIRDIRYAGLDAPSGSAIYVPWQNVPTGVSYLVLRTAGDPLPLAPAVRDIVRELDPSLPVPEMRSLEGELTASIADRRLRLFPAFGFATLALSVAFVGLLGTLSRAVTERRRELAVKAALGASPRHIVGAIMRKGALLTVVGIVLGLGASVAAGRSLAQLLYGVTPFDPLTFVAVTLLVAIASLTASYVPARRAARVDPMIVLRAE